MRLKTSHIVLTPALVSILFFSCSLLFSLPASGKQQQHDGSGMQTVSSSASPQELRSSTDQLKGELKKLDSELVKSGRKITGLNSNFGDTEDALRSMSETTGEMHALAKKIRNFHERVKGTTDTLSALEIIPTIGKFIVPMNGRLKNIEHKIRPVRKKTDKLDGKINRKIKPQMGELAERIKEARGELKQVGQAVDSAHKEIQDILACWPAILDASRLNHTIAFIKASRKTLNQANKATNQTNKTLSGVNREAKNLQSTLGPMKKATGKLSRFDKIFKKADKVNHEVSKVLDKKLKVKVGKKKFSFTVRKIVNGKVNRIAKKALNKMVTKMATKLFKRLHIKVPDLMGMDKFQKRLNDTESHIHNADAKVKEATGIPQKLRKVKSSMSSISASKLKKLKVCEAYIPPAH